MIKYQNISNELEFDTKIIPQNCGETIEQIDIGNYNSSCRYFLELECPRKIKFISEEIGFSGNVGSIKIPNIITENVGKVFIQLIVRNKKGEIVNKSLKSINPLYKVEESINAVKDLSNEKVNDCIAYIIQSVNELVSIKKELEDKVKNGDFNGKDGTTIKVNNVEQNELLFNDYPQKQLDDKVNITECNMLSLIPSDNFEVFLAKNNLHTFKNYCAKANGWISIRIDIDAPNSIGKFYQFIVSDKLDEYCIYNVCNRVKDAYDNIFTQIIPISKGQNFNIWHEKGLIITDIECKFIYVKEI